MNERGNILTGERRDDACELEAKEATFYLGGKGKTLFVTTACL